MALRIAFEADEGMSPRIRLDGRLTREELPELLLTTSAVDQRRPVRIDLTHLMSVDAEGLEALKQLREEGAEFLGASPYLRLLLGEAVD